jgi:hypothetical protein
MRHKALLELNYIQNGYEKFEVKAMQDLKQITQVNGQILLYPTPVIKHQKYLLLAHNPLQAQILSSGFAHGVLHLDAFKKIDVHTDGATPIYQLNGEMTSVGLLPERASNLERAMQLESILWKHIFNLYQADANSKSQLQSKLAQIYANQTSCSSCLALGIQAERLAHFFDEICYKI